MSKHGYGHKMLFNMILNGGCACTNQRWGVEIDIWEIQINLSNSTYLKWMICFDKEGYVAMLMVFGGHMKEWETFQRWFPNVTIIN
jgi:hypothetical protein